MPRLNAIKQGVLLARRMRLLDANLPWFGHSVLEAMEKAGIGVAREKSKRPWNKKES